jgi:hypothetical protein
MPVTERPGVRHRGAWSGVDLMHGSAVRGEDGPEPAWGEIKQRVASAAESVATAVSGLSLRSGDGGAVRAVEQAVAAFRDALGCLRPAVLDEAVVEVERARAADEALAAAGLVPPPRGRHLRVVS